MLKLVTVISQVHIDPHYGSAISAIYYLMLTGVMTIA